MGFNVLIVDDSTTIRSVVKKVLRLSGLDIGNCYEGSHGKEALEVLSEHWVDLILTDIHMPVMDGLEFLRRLKEDELLSRIPVVLVTTEGRGEKVEEAFALGARAYIQKPFRPEAIKGVLMEIMGEEYARDDTGEPEEGDF